ncbi:MAG TPA: hypothetical protein VKW77_03525, partial [Acidimicrobiales bacterium]|nr:hypothetical protein [Acidimicrobiales bacterium]
RAGVWVGRDRVLGLDLGGGSLEAAVGNVEEVTAVATAPLGTARLRGELGTGERLSPGDRLAVRGAVFERAGPVRSMLARYPAAAARVVASGGTVRALARLAAGLHRPPPPGAAAPSVNQMELPAGQLLELSERLASMDLDERLALPGIQVRRAPLLPVGAVVVSTLLETLGLTGLVVSEWGLREGAVLDRLALEGGAVSAAG